MEKNTKEKVSVEELNELSIVGGNDGNPEPRCSISNIIISTVLVSLVSFTLYYLSRAVLVNWMHSSVYSNRCSKFV